MLRFIFILYSFAVLFSCKTHESSDNVLRSSVFQIKTPKGWKLVIDKGIDSYVGRIIIDTIDYISFDYGRYSNSLEDYLKEPDSSHWTLYPPLSQLGDNRNSKAYYEMINNYKAKIVKPIITGIGVTGLYFDSLSSIDGSKISFVISGNNLNPSNEQLVLEAFKSITFFENHE